MSNIPLDLQRKCEQRWAARFAREVPPAASQISLNNNNNNNNNNSTRQGQKKNPPG